MSLNIDTERILPVKFSGVSSDLNSKRLTSSLSTGLQESDPRKATEIMMLSTESRLNSSGTSSQDSQRCNSVIKSMIF